MGSPVFSNNCIFVTIKVIEIIYFDSNSNIHRNDGSNQLNAMELKLTWTILIICFSFSIFVIPHTILNVFDPDSLYFGANIQVLSDENNPKNGHDTLSSCNTNLITTYSLPSDCWLTFNIS